MVQKAIEEREWLSKKQLADYWGTSERTINNFMKDGLPYVRAGNKMLRFRRSNADRWFENRFQGDENRVDRIVSEMLG